MTITPEQFWNFIWMLMVVKIIILGEFNFITWFRYGRSYRLWYSSRESFGEYLERTGKRKGW